MPSDGDILEVARFATLPEGLLAARLLQRHGIQAWLPDIHATTMNPDIVLAFGGVRVVATSGRIAEARSIIARARNDEFVHSDDNDDWREGAIAGQIGELDEGEVHGVMRQAKRAGVMVVALAFVVFPLASCVFDGLSAR